MDFFRLAGDSNTIRRSEVMRAFNQNNAATPRSRCGVNSMQQKFFQEFQIDPENTLCDASRMAKFREVAAKLLQEVGK